jgi:cytochrome P450
MSALIQAPAWASLKLDKYIFQKAIVARNRFVRFVMRVVKERMERPHFGGPSDVFSNLSAAKDPETGESFRPDEIAAESTTLIVAGSDTTSTSIASVFFYLAHNPRVYARASKEVRDNFAARSDISMGPSLASCTYLRACVDEAMRMSPAVGSSLWREVLPGGAIINGEVIPANSDVGVSIYSVHHNGVYFDEPFEYRPERWLVGEAGSTKESVETSRSAFMPFSSGVRGCLGKGIATTGLMLTLASVLHASDFKLAEGNLGRVGEGAEGLENGRHRKHEYQLYDHVTSQKKGPFLQFSPRE